MRLQCADILHILRYKPIVISMPNGEPAVFPASSKVRRQLLAPLLPLIHQAEKIIFDSGSDQDVETTSAVKETAVNMLEAKLFHQPFKTVWVEDPYEDNPDHCRNFYLATETATEITVRFFSKMQEMAGMGLPELVFHPYPMVIPLTDSDRTGDFLVTGVEEITRMYGKVLGEAIYAYKKLIVTLGSTNPVIERKQAGPRRGGDPRHREYDHQIIRVPYEYVEPREAVTSTIGTATATAPSRRRLVRGYVYGKNTRPVEQQRWIKPYWRGVGDIAPPTHYEVKG
jgi:hypothetical protein